ncbi:shikimate dehydrogenase family protein, partial [Microbacterium sp.]|uniref:shikimate dehydrogenase family protein n=1 Tax=Microbacterium sp. TaxID=51671 RepID=UPI003C774FED
MLTGATRLEVWGDPVSHSLSPRLHAAAYTRLGWDWSYDRRRVDLAGFAAALDGLDPRFRGLSLTFPLKAAAYEAATTRDRPAELTGAVNTLVLGGDDPRGGARRGFNTDVGGMAADLRDHGIAAVDRARIVGAGATATSALVALRELGADRVD